MANSTGEELLLDGSGWEYTHVQVDSMAAADLTRVLNDAGAKGWEAVSITNSDRMIGVNSLLVIIKRRLVPFDPPDDRSPDWYPDPSGRANGRYWDGEAWTFRVMTDGEESRDPPTRRTPAKVIQ